MRGLSARTQAIRLLLMAVLALPLPATGKTADGVIGPMMVPVTEGRGPSERIVGFRVALDAAAQRLKSDDVGRLGQAPISDSGAAQREAGVAVGRRCWAIARAPSAPPRPRWFRAMR